MRRLGRTVATAVLLAALGALAILGLGPRTGAYRTLTVLSGSMKPTFPPGSVVFVTPEPERDLAVGQVITYQAPIPGNPVVTHRVIQIVSGGAHPVVRTRGDANPVPDPWTARLGGTTAWRARADVPGAGRVISALRGRRTHELVVWGAPFLVALLFLHDIWGTDGTDEAAPSPAPVPER